MVVFISNWTWYLKLKLSFLQRYSQSRRPHSFPALSGTIPLFCCSTEKCPIGCEWSHQCNMLEQPPIKSWHPSIFTGINLPSGTIGTIFLVKNRPYPCCVQHALLSALPLTLEWQTSSSTHVVLYNVHSNHRKLLSRSAHHISGQAYCSAPSQKNHIRAYQNSISNSRQTNHI